MTQKLKINWNSLFTVLLMSACSGGPSSQSFEFTQSPEDVGELVIHDLLSRPDFMRYQTEEVQAVHYAEACAGYGAVKLAALLHQQDLLDNLITRYNRVEEDSLPNTANHVDANVYGILPLELYLHTKDEQYRNQGLELADGQWENPQADGLSRQTRFWIDDVYMISCLQVQAYRASGEMLYLERAALEADAYLQKLQQANGLFFHGPEAPFYWGRGNGWVAAGLTELLTVLPEDNPHYESLQAGYQKMMATLLTCQGEDGMWHQLIDRPESFRESSSTAMFGFAFTVGVKKGLLPEKPYLEASIKAWNALTGYLDSDGRVREVCVGTGQSADVDYYLSRPRITGDLHGQAPVLWFAHSLLADYR